MIQKSNENTTIFSQLLHIMRRHDNDNSTTAQQNNYSKLITSPSINTLKENLAKSSIIGTHDTEIKICEDFLNFHLRQNTNTYRGNR